MAWCAGFGRLGGIFGPLIGGFLLGAGVASSTAFYLFAAVALMGALVTTAVPKRRVSMDAVEITPNDALATTEERQR